MSARRCLRVTPPPRHSREGRGGERDAPGRPLTRTGGSVGYRLRPLRPGFVQRLLERGPWPGQTYRPRRGVRWSKWPVVSGSCAPVGRQRLSRSQGVLRREKTPLWFRHVCRDKLGPSPACFSGRRQPVRRPARQPSAGSISRESVSRSSWASRSRPCEDRRAWVEMAHAEVGEIGREGPPHGFRNHAVRGIAGG